MTTLVFCDTLPPGGGWYAHYRHHRLAATGWEFCDVRAIVGEHQEAWLDRIDAWHRELCAEAQDLSPWWWLLPGSRLAAWYPVDLKPLLFAVGVIEAFRLRPDLTLHLVACPAEVGTYLSEWAARHSVVRLVSTPHDGGRPAGWRGPAGPLREAARAVRSLAVRRLGRHSSAIRPAGVLVISQTLEAGLLARVGDHFFGRVFDGPAVTADGGFLWLYFVSRYGERDAARRFCDSVGRRVVFDFDVLEWSDIALTLRAAQRVRAALQPLASRLPPLSVGELTSVAFPARFWRAAIAGRRPVSEIAVYHAVRRCLDASQARVVIYPYEEKGLERAILKACAGRGPVVRTVALAHAAYNSGHLYLRRGRTNPPRPDVLATTGPAARDWLCGWAGRDPAHMEVTGSPRFSSAETTPRPFTGRPLHVLVLSGYGSEPLMLAEFVEQMPDLFAGHAVTLRPYPHGWRAEQRTAFARLKRVVSSLEIQGGDLQGQIDRSDCVIFASTSAAIEAIHRGRFAIHAALHDIVDANPFRDRAGASEVPSCSTPQELRAALSAVAAMGPEAYARAIAGQRRLATGLYAPPDAMAFRRLFNVA